MIDISVELRPIRKARAYDLLYVLPEWEVTGKSRPQNNGDPTKRDSEGNLVLVYGLPATVKFYEPVPVALLSEDGEPLDTHRLLRDEFASQCPSSWSMAEIDKHLAGYLKDGVCYTDHTDPIAWNSIVTCGNVLYPTGKTRRTTAGILYEVMQLQADTYAKMALQLAAYPFLRTWATNSTRGYGGREVTGFPQCGGNPVPALLFGRTGTNWIIGSRVRMLDRSEPIPPIYYP